MTKKVPDRIINVLDDENDPLLVREIAEKADCSPGYARQVCKGLLEEGAIEGGKTAPMLAAIIDDEFVPLPLDRDSLLAVLDEHGSRPTGTGGWTPKEIREYIMDNLADQVVTGNRAWTFWRN